MSVFSEIGTSIYSTLTGGTALTNLLHDTTSVYQMQVPDNVDFDYVVFNVQGGGDENITPSRMKNLVLFVRGYSTSLATSGSIDAQVDALLHGQTLTVAGWANFWTARETDIQNAEVMPNGDKIFMAGGMYRIRIQKN